jgi:hypothetical protein
MAESWYVQDGKSKAIGPVTTDLLIEGIKEGRVPVTSRVCAVGEDKWTPLASHASFANAVRELAPPPPTGFSSAPPPRAPGAASPSPSGAHPVERAKTNSPRARKMILVAAGAIAALAVLGVGSKFAMLAAKKRALPILAEKLPPMTTGIVQSRLDSGLNAAMIPNEYIASALADEMCGGEYNAVDVIASARGKTLEQLRKTGFLDLTSDAQKKAMKCGETLRASLIDTTSTEIEFDEGDQHLSVTALRTSLKELPTEFGFARHTFSGLDGACLREPDAKVDCPDNAASAFHDGTTWFFGTAAATTAFARAYTTSRTELTTNVETLGRVLDKTTTSERVHLVAKPTVIPWLAPCYAAAPGNSSSEFIASCFPKDEQRTLDAILAKTKGLAVESDSLARSNSSTLRFTYVLVARDADGAKELEADVSDLARDWRAQIGNNEPAMSKLVREHSALINDDFVKATFDPFIRAMKAMTVSREGDVVRLVITTTLRPEEEKSVHEFLATRTSDQTAKSHIVNALTQGTAIQPGDLATFVDAPLVSWMLAPKATAADCRTFRDQVKKVAQNAPLDQFGLKFHQEKRFEDAQCVGIALPAEAKQCLLAATDLNGIAGCSIVTSAAVALATTKLNGQWLVEIPSSAPIGGSRLEAKDGKVIFAVQGATPATANAEIEARDDEWSFILPLPNDSKPRFNALISPEGKLVLFEGKVSKPDLVFKNASFDTSLFAQAKQ